MAFVSGGCRVVTDLPPYMLAAGNDNPEVKTINLVGMRRAGVSASAIEVIKRAHRLIFREQHRSRQRGAKPAQRSCGQWRKLVRFLFRQLPRERFHPARVGPMRFFEDGCADAFGAEQPR